MKRTDEIREYFDPKRLPPNWPSEAHDMAHYLLDRCEKLEQLVMGAIPAAKYFAAMERRIAVAIPTNTDEWLTQAEALLAEGET